MSKSKLVRQTLLLGAILAGVAGPAAAAPIGTQIGHWTDYSGSIDVKVFRCDAVYGELNTSSCSVPADYAIVGGGAETCATYPGSGPCPNLWGQPGALLTASYPSDTGTWTASSKDHAVVYNHYLRVYAIGMKLYGLTHPVDLRSQLHFSYGTWPDPNTSGYALVAATDLLVGGGAFTNWSWPGELLIQSYPVPTLQPSQGAWYAESGNPVFGEDPFASVTAVAIGVPRCPDTYTGCLTGGLYSWNGPHGGGYEGSTIPQPDQGWATTSIGGIAEIDPSQWNYNRYITSMIPEVGFARGSATVWTKDHVNAQSGWSLAYSLVVAKQWW
jgi:hypothetical protein